MVQDIVKEFARQVLRRFKLEPVFSENRMEVPLPPGGSYKLIPVTIQDNGRLITTMRYYDGTGAVDFFVSEAGLGIATENVYIKLFDDGFIYADFKGGDAKIVMEGSEKGRKAIEVDDEKPLYMSGELDYD